MTEKATDWQLKRPISLAKLEDGKAYNQHIALTAEELVAAAEVLKLATVKAVKADITVKPRRKGREILVQGTVKAQIVQNCVVTLEPMTNTVSATFERLFAKQTHRTVVVDEEEIEIDPLSEDPPDEFFGSTLDVGPLILEEVALNLDLYPRKSGALVEDKYLLDEAEEIVEEKRPNPFAGLADLKAKSDKG